METTVRTIYSSHLATCKYINAKFYPLENSTLNERFNVATDMEVVDGEYPRLNYIMFGNRGVKYEALSENQMTTIPLAHLPRHACLYGPIPMVVVEADDDLHPEERDKYRLRKEFHKDGIDYIAYYLKVLNVEDVMPMVERRHVEETMITTTNFTPTPQDLEPEEEDLMEVDINNPDGDYLVSSAKVQVEITEGDIARLKNACEIMFGDSRLAIISEIAVCTGVDRVYPILDGGGQQVDSYTEVIAAQVSTFLAQYYAIANMSSGFVITLDVGSVEPMLFSPSNP